MKQKNVIVIILLTSIQLNVLLGYKLLNVKLQNKATSSGLVTSNIDKTRIFNIQSMRESIISRYKPTNTHCGATISMSSRNEHAGTDQFDMACLINGNRKIAHLTLQSIKEDFDAQLMSFEYAAKSENIKEIDGISFRPEGEREALLFVKQKLLSNVGALDSNDYLWGYLLGYTKEDIEFFYQRWAFIQYLDRNQLANDAYLTPATFPEFTPQLKSLFAQFIKNDWGKSEAYQKYILDQQRALQWIKENENFSNEKLYKQIRALK